MDIKIKNLTEEQKKLIPKYRQMYLDKFFHNTHVATQQEVEEYIHWFYQEFEINDDGTLPKVILVDSPLAIIREIQKYKEIVKGEKNVKREWYTPSYYLSAFNSWIAFYDFYNQEYEEFEISNLFNSYKKILDLNIFWTVPFDEVVFVSRNAVEFNLNDENIVHSINGPAIKFADGFEMYFINGVHVEKQFFDKLKNKEFTFQDFIQISNEEIRACAIKFIEERWGTGYLMDFFNQYIKEVDTYIDKKAPEYLEGTHKGMNIGVYTLFKGKIGNINLSYVRCYCPSTDRMFFLGVDHIQENAKDAIASLYRIPVKLKNHIKYIQRQGERFSTVLTEDGKKLVKSLTKEELADMTHISGDEYFYKMRYEY